MKFKELNNILVSPHGSIREVMGAIDRNGNGVSLVVDEQKRLLGITTDGDIRRAILRGKPLNTPIMEIMNQNPIFIKEGFTNGELAELVNNSSIRVNHLPIVDNNLIPIGILLYNDIYQRLGIPHKHLFGERTISNTKVILIFGGAGFIGSVLSRKLLDQGYFVRIFDKFLFGEGPIADLKSNPHFSWIQGDVGNISDIVDAISGVDAVVYLAEIVGDPACAVNPKKTQQVNYLSSAQVARVCHYFNINRFIYTSSCSVYGAGENIIFTEQSPLNPLSLYARMKIESEKTILSMADGIFSPTILRLATVFGKSPRMRFDLVVNMLTAKALIEKKITIIGGNQWRPFVHVEDVAQSVIRVLEAPIENISGEIFNVGSDKNNKTIQQIGEIVKKTVPHAEIIIQKIDSDNRNYRASFLKIKKILSYNAEKSIEEGVTEIALIFSKGEIADYTHPKYSNHKTVLAQEENLTNHSEKLSLN